MEQREKNIGFLSPLFIEGCGTKLLHQRHIHGPCILLLLGIVAEMLQHMRVHAQRLLGAAQQMQCDTAVGEALGVHEQSHLQRYKHKEWLGQATNICLLWPLLRIQLEVHIRHEVVSGKV